MPPKVVSPPPPLSRNLQTLHNPFGDHDHNGRGGLPSSSDYNHCHGHEHEHDHDHDHDYGHSHGDTDSHELHLCTDHLHDHGDTHHHHHAHSGGCGHSNTGCGHQHTGWKQFAPHGHSLHTRLAADKRALSIALLILVLSFAIQLTAAIIGSSSMLIVESLHSLVDGLTVVLSLVSTVVAAYPSTARMSYGYGRAEVLSALLSLVALAMLCTKLGIGAVLKVYATFSGKGSDVSVNGRIVVLAEAITLSANIGMAIVLSKGATSSLNIRAVRAHVIADSLENFVVLVAGAVIWLFPNASLIDPLLTIVVVIMLLTLNFRIAKETVEVVMQAAPGGVVEDAEKNIAEIQDIAKVDSLHVWTVTTGVVIASVRVFIPAASKLQDAERVRNDVVKALLQAGIQDTCVEVIVSTSYKVHHPGDNIEGRTVPSPEFHREIQNDADVSVSLIEVEDTKEALGYEGRE